MALLDWLTGRRTDRAAALASPWAADDHLEAITLAHLLEVDVDQRPITRADAMSIPVIARGRNTLVALASRLPLEALTAAGPVTPQPWITRKPESGIPRSISVAWTIDQMIFYGRAWWAIRHRDTYNRPAIVTVVPETAMTFDAEGDPAGINGKPWPAAEWVRIDAHHEGILTYGRATLGEALDLRRAIRKAAANPVPSVELHQTTPAPTLTNREKQDIVAAWVAARRKSGVAFTPHNLDVRTHGQAAEQLLIEARNAVDRDLSRLIGVPAYVADVTQAGSSLTYSNIESRTREVLDYGLSPYLTCIEDRLSLDDVLPRGQWAHFDTSLVTRGDLATRAAAYSAAQAAGILTKDQCLALEAGQPKE